MTAVAPAGQPVKDPSSGTRYPGHPHASAGSLLSPAPRLAPVGSSTPHSHHRSRPPGRPPASRQRRLVWHSFALRLFPHLALLLTLVIWSLAAGLLVPGRLPNAPPEQDPAMPWSTVEALILQYGCWSGIAPQGRPVPRHAVVSLPGRPAALVSARVGFSIWLGPDGVAGTGDERAGILHAFCP